MAAPKKYPDELRERAVREVVESGRPIARDLGIHPEALRNWVRQGEADRGERTDRATTSEQDELARLRHEMDLTRHMKAAGESRPVDARRHS